MTIDGAFTSNDPKVRVNALERAKKAIDISHELETNLLVLWLAREGTYLREAKDAYRATRQSQEAINALLDYDPTIRIAIEPSQNQTSLWIKLTFQLWVMDSRWAFKQTIQAMLEY